MKKNPMNKIKILIAGLFLVFSGLVGGNLSAVELTMYYPVAVGGPLTKIVDGLVKEFMKENPGIKVNAIYAGNYTETMTKAMTALRSGNPPQLSVLLSTEIFTLIDNNAIVSFGDIVTSREEKAWLQKFYPALMENSRTAGKTWGIPFQRSTIVMYYNKDMYRKAGLDPERPPKSWYELVEIGKKLTQNGSWGLEIPSTGYPYWMFGALSIQNDQVLMNNAGNKTYFNETSTVEALQFWLDLSQKHKIMPKGTIEWGTLRSDFLEGKTAMMWHSTGNLTTVKKNAKFDFGVSILPANVRPGSPTGGGNFYIFKDSTQEEKAASIKFIKWMTQPERTGEWSIKTGYMGTRADAYETAKLKKYAMDFPPAAVARDQLKYATAELSTHEGGRIVKILNDAIQSALTGKKSPKAALDSAQKQAIRILRRYK